MASSPRVAEEADPHVEAEDVADDEDALPDLPITLPTLDDELLLCVCESLDARQLCRLACVCTRLSAPAAPHADGEVLSLTERAAKCAVQAAHERGDTRGYTRGPSERWTQVLTLFERGLMRRGVLYAVPLGAVTSRDSGWIKAYDERYEHKTSDEDLERVPLEARYVLIGAVDMSGAMAADGTRQRSPGRDELDRALEESNPLDTLTFTLAAWGPREEVLRTTHDEQGFSGGRTTTDNQVDAVYWYRWPRHSFGFTADPKINLWFADVEGDRRFGGSGDESSGESRLSWNLETISTGGFRAGKNTDLGEDSQQFYKRVYYRL